MAFQVSPGVLVKEIDLTNVIPAVSTSIGAIAGAFRWGPVGEIRTIGSEKDLANVYGSPDDYTYKYFLPAGQFLKYGNALRVVRAETSGMQNSVSYSTKEITENFTGDGTDTFTLVELRRIIRYQGMMYNSRHLQDLEIQFQSLIVLMFI